MIACVGAVIHDDRGRLLLIRRGQEPGRGLWSLPGGRVEPGETDHEAVVREVAEETGLRVRPGRLVGRVSRAAPSGAVYDIADYECELAGDDVLRPDTDADDARWVTAADYAGLPLVYGMTEVLTEWNQLPRT
ncbi:MAG TPA: NUDIX domain-containing protein [Pseudonocardia sp.]|nr:NUDIX domain-containing protein [Pseudonocardia sp.]